MVSFTAPSNKIHMALDSKVVYQPAATLPSPGCTKFLHAGEAFHPVLAIRADMA